MKAIILTIIAVTLFSSCVQKAYEREVTVYLTVKGKQNIKTVGILGDGNKLDWDKALPLQEVVKDSLYTTTFKMRTGYLLVEAAFTVNDTVELKDKPNRRIQFAKEGGTVYRAVFDEN